MCKPNLWALSSTLHWQWGLWRLQKGPTDIGSSKKFLKGGNICGISINLLLQRHTGGVRDLAVTGGMEGALKPRKAQVHRLLDSCVLTSVPQ